MTADAPLDAVTGAFGYSGRAIAERLLAAGARVRTLTDSPDRANPFGGAIEVHPYSFDDPSRLARSLEGVRTLYSTYWVRFDHDDFSHAQAVANGTTLFAAARAAGVERVVHVSVANPDADSELPYFAGKARLEAALQATGLSHAILRPAVFFGREDILVNNIAWALRRLPVFGVFGDGRYRLQPIHVDDFADLALRHGAGRDDVVVDAIGPETFTYRELVQAIGAAIGKPRPIVGVPPWAGLLVARVMGRLMGDVLLTRDEIAGLMQGRLCVESPPTGTTSLSAWARDHADTLGRHYASELARRRDRRSSYAELEEAA